MRARLARNKSQPLANPASPPYEGRVNPMASAPRELTETTNFSLEGNIVEIITVEKALE